MSCTSLPMQWNKPRGAKILPEKVCTYVFASPNNTERKKEPIQSTFRCPFYNDVLKDITNQEVGKLRDSLGPEKCLTSFFYIAGNENPAPTVSLSNGMSAPRGSLELMDQGFSQTLEVHPCSNERNLPISLPNLRSDAVNILLSLPPVHHSRLEEITFEHSIAIEKATRSQSKCGMWKDLRRLRFTASNFGAICKRRLFNVNFLEPHIQGPKDISNIGSVRHGLENENTAISLYLLQNTTVKYFKCGLVVHPYASHLGASPDGILYKEGNWGILEVKCPCTRKAERLSGYLKMMPTFCLKENNGELILKRTHSYFYQVQGQMLLTGLQFCEFVVYIKSSQELLTVTVAFDFNLCDDMYKKLTNIYETYICPLSPPTNVEFSSI